MALTPAAKRAQANREAIFGKPKAKAEEVVHPYTSELEELQGLIKRTKDPELQQAAWDMSLKKLYSELPMVIGGKTYNLAPNASTKIFQRPDGTIIKVPASRPDMAPRDEGSQ